MLTRILTTHKQMLNIRTQVPWAVQTHPALKFSLALDACPPTPSPELSEPCLSFTAVASPV